MLSSSQRQAVRVDRRGTLGWLILFSLALHLTLLLQGSGSSVLDAAAVAVFRNAHLPPLPPGSLAQPADVVVTLHYHPADSGG